MWPYSVWKAPRHKESHKNSVKQQHYPLKTKWISSLLTSMTHHFWICPSLEGGFNTRVSPGEPVFFKLYLTSCLTLRSTKIGDGTSESAPGLCAVLYWMSQDCLFTEFLLGWCCCFMELCCWFTIIPWDFCWSFHTLYGHMRWFTVCCVHNIFLFV